MCLTSADNPAFFNGTTSWQNYALSRHTSFPKQGSGFKHRNFEKTFKEATRGEFSGYRRLFVFFSHCGKERLSVRKRSVKNTICPPTLGRQSLSKRRKFWCFNGAWAYRKASEARLKNANNRRRGSKLNLPLFRIIKSEIRKRKIINGERTWIFSSFCIKTYQKYLDELCIFY